MLFHGDVRDIRPADAKDFITLDVGGMAFTVHISRLELLIEEMERIGNNIDARKRLGSDS